jgi:cytochrome P450
VTLERLLQKQPVNTNMAIVMDPPEHTRMRKPLSQACSRNAIGSLGAGLARFSRVPVLVPS